MGVGWIFSGIIQYQIKRFVFELHKLFNLFVHAIIIYFIILYMINYMVLLQVKKLTSNLDLVKDVMRGEITTYIH